MTASLLLLLAACSPYGWISTPLDTDRLRTAWHYEWTGEDGPVLLLGLANSPLPCAVPSTLSSEEAAQLTLDYWNAVTREGARVVGLKLYTSAEAWTGRYPVSEIVDTSAFDDLEPRGAEALYIGVNEATAQEMHGLYRLYEPTDKDEVFQVEAPGEVVVEKEGSRMEGTFSLDSLDVSGSFKTEPCDAADLFLWLGLLEMVDG